MKTHAILINANQYGLETCDLDIEQINNVVNYALRPFIQLKILSYNDYSSVPSIISGADNPQILLGKVIICIEYQHKIICSTKITMGKHNISNDMLSNMQHFSGKYTYDSVILNTANNSSIITSENLMDIQASPQDYIIAFTNVYK